MKKHLALLTIILACSMGFTGCALPGAASKKELSYREQAIDLMEAGEYELAVEMFDLALGQTYGFLTDTDLDICYYKALAQYKLGSTVDAINTYDAIVDIKEKDWRAYYLRGTLYLESTDYEDAQADYASCLKYNGKDGDMLIHIAANLEDAGYSDDALTYYNEVINNGGKDAADMRNIGWASYKLGSSDAAIEYLQQAVNAGDGEAMYYLAEVNMDQGDYSSALSLIDQGLSAGSDESGNTMSIDESSRQQLMFAKVICYEYMGQWESAKTAISEYVEAYPEDEDGQSESTFLENR